MTIRSEFTVHMLNDDGIEKATALAGVFSQALDAIEAICGKDGREIAIVRTHFQDACFHAKRAMAEKPENQRASAV